MKAWVDYVDTAGERFHERWYRGLDIPGYPDRHLVELEEWNAARDVRCGEAIDSYVAQIWWAVTTAIVDDDGGEVMELHPMVAPW